MSSMDKYKVRAQAQTPRKVYLRDPSTGKETEDFLEVLSSLSDEFLEARDEAMQEAGQIATKDVAERKKLVKDIQLRMRASIVSGWSFPEPCTKENVVEFLRESPTVQQLITAAADNHAAFFSKPSDVSASGPKKK